MRLLLTSAIKVILLTPLSVSSKKSINPLPVELFPIVNPWVAFNGLYALISVEEYVDITTFPLVITVFPLVCGFPICKSSKKEAFGVPTPTPPLIVVAF